MYLRLLGSTTLALVLGVGLDQTSLAAPADPPAKVMAQLDACAASGREALPGESDWREDRASYASKLAAAKPHYDVCKQLLPKFESGALGTVPSYQSDGWRTFVRRYELALLERDVLALWEPINRAHRRGIAVVEEDLVALEQAFAQMAPLQTVADGKTIYFHWNDRVPEARERNAKLAKSSMPRAVASIVDVDFAKRGALLSGLERLSRELLGSASEGTSPLGDARIAAFDAKLKEGEAVDPTLRAGFAPDLFALRVHNAWFASAPSAAVAKAVGATEVLTGTASAASTIVRVKGAAQTCYAILGRYSGRDFKGAWDVRVVPDARWFDRQGMNHSPSGRGYLRAEGACTIEAHDFDLELRLKEVGIAFDYVVVAWAKASIPMEILAEIATVNNDRCDATHYKRVFLNPFPKLSLYSESGVPFIYQTAADGNARLADGSNVRLFKFRTSPDKARLAMAYSADRCEPDHDAQDPMLKAYSACVDKVSRQHDPKVDAAERAVDNARTSAAAVAAERRLASAREARDAALQKACEPLHDKLKAGLQSAADEVYAWYATQALELDASLVRYVDDVSAGRRAFDAK